MLLSRKALGAFGTTLLLLVATIVNTGASLAAPSRSDLEGARSRLMELEREFQLVAERYNLVNDRLASLQARIGQSEAEIHDIERRMRARQATAIDLATELYKNGRAIQIEGVLSADSLSDLDTRVTYLETSA